MRLGVNATLLGAKPTGIGVFTREVSPGLCRLCTDTRVFTSVALRGVDTRCIERTPAAIQGSPRLIPNILRFLYCNTALPLTVRRKGMDILYCPVMEYPFTRSAPLVVTVHDLHPVYFPEQFGLSALHYRLSLRFLSRLVRRVTCPSHFVKSELERLGTFAKDRVDVVPNGYDSSFFRPQRQELKEEFLVKHELSGPYILFVGSLFPYKNVSTLVTAFTGISDRVPHTLVIIGKREVSRREELEVSDRVRHFNYVESGDLARFYSFADFLVHPSLAEGFGLTVLEAMACGTPVICSRGGSLPEVAGDAAILVDPKDSLALARAIKLVAGDSLLRADMREKGLRQATKFTWDKTAEGVFRSCAMAAEGSVL